MVRAREGKHHEEDREKKLGNGLKKRGRDFVEDERKMEFFAHVEMFAVHIFLFFHAHPHPLETRTDK